MPKGPCFSQGRVGAISFISTALAESGAECALVLHGPGRALADGRKLDVGAERRHFGDQRQRQPPHSRRDHPGPHFHQGRGCLRSGRPGARLQLVVEHRLLRGHQDPAGANAQGLAHDRPGEGKADDPHNRLRRRQFGFQQRHPRPLQAGQSRPGGREPVRSHPHQESGSLHQGPAVRTRAPVRHDPHRSAADSSRRGRHYVRGQGRAEGQSRQDQVRRQQEHQFAHSARGHEEPEADRHSALDFPGESFSRRPTTPPSWKKTPSGCGRSTRTAATSRWA